jgi:hypothetical protein
MAAKHTQQETHNMKAYRVSVPAVVNFTVAANSEQEARKIAAAIADGGDSARFDWQTGIPAHSLWFQVWIDLWEHKSQKMKLSDVTLCDSGEDASEREIADLVKAAKEEAHNEGMEKYLPAWMRDKATA